MSELTPDQQQVARLCHDVAERLVVGQPEESLLTSLVLITARPRVHQSCQYQALLEAARQRQKRLWELFNRYCHGH